MRAIAHTPPAAKIRELPGIKAVPEGRSSRVMPRQIINEVRAPRWLGYATGKSHAFLIPAGSIADASVKTVCGRVMDSARLSPSKGARCKSCASLLTEDTRKRGTGLSEPVTDNVATGSTNGDPKDAELRRSAELEPLFGEASKINGEIVESLRDDDKESAVALARKVDRSAREVNAKAPHAERTPIGNRDHGRLDGVAMVQGPNDNGNEGAVTDWVRPKTPPGGMPACLVGAPLAESNPEAPRRTWRNPATGEVEPAAPRLDGSLRERGDRTIVERVDRDGLRPDTAKRSKASKRRYRARKTAERAIRERVQGRGERFVPKGRMVDPVKAELKRLRNGGEQLPLRGW